MASDTALDIVLGMIGSDHAWDIPPAAGRSTRSGAIRDLA